MKKLNWLWLVVLSIALITGCSKEPQSLNIGVMSDVGAIPFVIAEKEGYFEEAGLDVNIEVFRSAVDRDTALQTGNLDGAMADMLTVFFYNQAGYDVKATSQTYGNYKLVSSPALDEASFLALDEQQIGLSSNTVIDYATSKVAASKGFESTLVKVAIPQMPVRLEMLGAGELNGATLPEPLASAAMLSGGTVIGQTEDFDLYPGIFIMNSDVIKDNEEAIKKFYEAYNKAVDYINSNEVESYFDLLVSDLGFPEILKGQFEMPTLVHAEPADQATFDDTMSWMKDAGLLDGEFTYDTLTTDAYLQ